MVVEDRLERRLPEVDEEIVPANVRQLVCQIASSSAGGNWASIANGISNAGRR
jgi:hypothetical protein